MNIGIIQVSLAHIVFGKRHLNYFLSYILVSNNERYLIGLLGNPPSDSLQATLSEGTSLLEKAYEIPIETKDSYNVPRKTIEIPAKGVRDSKD